MILLINDIAQRGLKAIVDSPEAMKLIGVTEKQFREACTIKNAMVMGLFRYYIKSREPRQLELFPIIH